MRHMFGLDATAIILDLNLDAFSRYGTVQRHRTPEAHACTAFMLIEEDLIDFAGWHSTAQVLEAGLNRISSSWFVAGDLERGSECRMRSISLNSASSSRGNHANSPQYRAPVVDLAARSKSRRKFSRM